MTNTLYYGDNLEILRRYVKDESVDLIYLDPPFKSNQSYNVLFSEKNGTDSASQIEAFEDTWHWDRKSEDTLSEIMEFCPPKVVNLMDGLIQIIGRNDMMAYLVMMAIRIQELRRVMKPTASIYLHCDPTASHYLKLLMDAIFGPTKFRTEIIWKRSSFHSDTKQGRKQHGRIHDVIFFYTKTDDWTWNPIHTPYDQEYLDNFYRHIEPGTGKRYRLGDLTAAKPGGDTSYEWKGAKPYKGRYWAYSRENMEVFERDDRLVYTKTGMPNYKRYLDEMPGVPLQDLWTDIRPIGASAAERLGYPTQKPEALLERIVAASSNKGDVVLDPFCGCGTTVVAAQKLKRAWIGIDITHLAILLMKYRLESGFDKRLLRYEVTGSPVDLKGAEALANQDRFQFEMWALSLLGDAKPAKTQGRGADQGIDGCIFFRDEEGKKAKIKRIIIQVKSGKVSVSQIRDLKGAMAREKAEIAAFITLQKPTSPMTKEALAAGYYEHPSWQQKYPRLQIITIEELLEGKTLEHPPVTATLKESPKHEEEDTSQGRLLEG